MKESLWLHPPSRTALANELTGALAGEDEDWDRAIDLLEWAAEDDEPEALFFLGVVYMYGRGGRSVDTAKAVEYFQRAVVHEDPRAMNALGMLLRNGDGIEQDLEQSREYARRSAEAGFPIGQTNYGRHLIDGTGGPATPIEGAVWLRRAVDQQFTEAMLWLAIAIEQELVEAASGESATELLDCACRLGCPTTLIWRAQQEMQKPDANADFPKALGYLIGAYRSRSGDQKSVQALLKGLHERFTVYLLKRPNDHETAELHNAWYHVLPEGKPRFESILDIGKSVAGSVDSDFAANMLDYQIRAYAGPGVSEAEIQRRVAFIKMQVALDKAEKAARDAAIPKVGRNKPCPCGSGKKYKRCHGLNR